MTPADRLRLFIALELPPAWRSELGEQSRRLESAVPGFTRWVQPDLMHLTLVFLGAQPASIVPAIESAMDEAAAATSGFSIATSAPGSFGSPRALRVVWVGVQATPRGALDALHGRLVASLEQAGVTFEPSAFRPHLTLGRARRDESAARSQLMHRAVQGAGGGPSSPLNKLGEFDCEEITLVRSDLRPTGPIYTPLRRAPFMP